MWVTTIDGFYSAVADRDNPGSLVVRARRRDDLDRLTAAVMELSPTADVRVHFTPQADYPYRTFLSKVEWAGYLGHAVAECQYDNFKDAVEAADPVYGRERHNVYLDVWETLRNLLTDDEAWTASVRRCDRALPVDGLDALDEIGEERRCGVTGWCDELVPCPVHDLPLDNPT